VLSIVCAVLLGYLLGSVPTAYLLVRWKSALDIRHAGSGNVGTLNSYEVTGSRWIGALVLVGDALKGSAAVLAARLLWETGFPHEAVAGIAAVAGHNFPCWLRFRGGRGLATSVGVFAVLGWPVVALWVCFWGPSFLALRKVNPANALATTVLAVVFLAVPGEIVAFAAPAGVSLPAYRFFALSILLLILTKHWPPVREFIRESGRSSERHESQ
jgi:glycerol-3-phosphate acyltransferase PlsY